MATARKDFDAADFDAGRRPAGADGRTSRCSRWSGSSTRRVPAAKAAIATAHAAGIQVRMITGDHAVTAEAIARELGIEGRAITGAQFAELSDEQADERDRRDRRDRARDARAEGPPRRHPQAQGPRRRHDRRRRQRRPGAQAGRHRHRDGHHRHRGLQGGRGDDPHRRQLRDDRQGGRARARALRQPRQVHPLPDGRARRDDRDVPRREHPQHRQRHPVPAAADAVGQLHDAGLPGDRARATASRARG